MADKSDTQHTYLTIDHEAEGRFTEKMSRFLSFALSVADSAQAKEKIKLLANRYHDARHVCWAYMVGPQRQNYLLTDNGEPSGTAGKPILGQINSRRLTNVAVVVVRYFGGIKLGTPGLIAAYREAASIALDNAGTKEITRTRIIDLTVPYAELDKAMRIIKDQNLNILSQQMSLDCRLSVEAPLNIYDDITKRFEKITQLKFNSSDGLQ